MAVRTTTAPLIAVLKRPKLTAIKQRYSLDVIHKIAENPVLLLPTANGILISVFIIVLPEVILLYANNACKSLFYPSVRRDHGGFPGTGSVRPDD